MALRHNPFDMNAPARIAADAIGASSCVKIEKTTEGLYNKIFLMTMEDGTEVIAKVPNKNARPAHLTIITEVATIDFAHNHLETPVPKVLDWNSNAVSTPVGAEYIIMEKDKISIMRKVVGYHKSWINASFQHFGSLYSAKDLEGDQKAFSYTKLDETEIVDSRFAIGPTVGRSCVDEGRSEIDFDRGPWSTVEDCQIAIVVREATCIKTMKQLPKSPLTLPGPYVPTRERKLATINLYLKLVKYLIPTDNSITISNIWHDDLHSENIHINPLKPSEIVGIIDWQSVALVPLF